MKGQFSSLLGNRVDFDDFSGERQLALSSLSGQNVGQVTVKQGPAARGAANLQKSGLFEWLSQIAKRQNKLRFCERLEMKWVFENL